MSVREDPEGYDDPPEGSHEGSLYPEFPTDLYRNKLQTVEREAFLEYYGFLPDDYDELSEEERENYVDEYALTSWQQDVDESGGEIDPEMPHIYSTVGEDQPSRQTGTSMVEGVPLGIEPEVELVGNNEATVIIGDVDVIGAYLYRRQSEGFESQYLTEIEAGGSDSEENTYGADNPRGKPGGPQPTSGEVPPETVIIEAYVGFDRMEELRAMRDSDETFEVQIEDWVLEEMELVSVTAEVTGEQPYNYYAEIEVREWREYDTGEGESEEDPASEYTEETDETEGDEEDVEESGSEAQPNVMSTDEGESRNVSVGDGERIRNAEIDASAPDSEASVTADVSDWAVREVGIRGGGETRPALLLSADEGSTGEVDTVMIDGDSVMADGVGYDVVEVSGVEIVEVGPGETLEHVLYDVSGGGRVAIIANGDGWKIDSIAIEGEMDSGAVISATVPEGGMAEIENIYMADGHGPGQTHGSGIYTEPEHEGHLEIQQANFGSINEYSVDSTDSPGTVSIDRTYSANPGEAHFRVNDATITRSTAVNNEYGDAGTGVQARGGGVTVKNCQLPMNGDAYAFDAEGEDGDYATIEARHTNWDNSYNGGYREGTRGTVYLVIGNETNAHDLDPQGCPMTATVAASGTTYVPNEGVESAPLEVTPRFGEGGFGQGGYGGSSDWGSDERDEYDGPLPPPAIYVDSTKSRGDIHIKDVYIRNWPGRAIYAVAEEETGQVTIENVYARNCRGVQIEMGTPVTDEDF